MIVAIRNRGHIRLADVKVSRDGTYRTRVTSTTIPARNVIPLENLTEEQREKILADERETRRRDAEFQIAKDATLADHHSAWIEAIDRLTFDDVLHEFTSETQWRD